MKEFKTNFLKIHKRINFIFAIYLVSFQITAKTKPELPLKKVVITVEISADAYDAVPKNISRNDTSFYSDTTLFFKSKLVDANLTLWDSIISQSNFYHKPDTFQISGCLCTCNSADISLTDATNQVYRFFYEDCGNQEYLVKSKKCSYILKEPDSVFNKMDIRIKQSFTNELKRLKP